MKKLKTVCIGIIGVVILTLGCRGRQGDYILRVSFEKTVHTIDVIRDTVIEGDTIVYYPYYSTTVFFSFEEDFTESYYDPVVSVDSFRIYFYDLSTDPPTRIRLEVADEYSGSVDKSTYEFIRGDIRVEVDKGEEVEAGITLIPSYIIQQYNPFYSIRNGNPSFKELWAEYEFFAHEIFSGEVLEPVRTRIKLEVSDYLD